MGKVPLLLTTEETELRPRLRRVRATHEPLPPRSAIKAGIAESAWALPRRPTCEGIHEHCELCHANGPRCRAERSIPRIPSDRDSSIVRGVCEPCFRNSRRKIQQALFELRAKYLKCIRKLESLFDCLRIIFNTHYLSCSTNRIQIYSIRY